MGGNVKVGNLNAQVIDMSKIKRKSFVKTLIKELKVINQKFEEIYGIKIWEKESFLTSGKVFSGSSEHFINLDISDEEYAKYKKTTGDIDVQVSETIEKQLHEFFKDNKKFGELTYIGQSNTAIGQISALFNFENINIQIDFEFVDIGTNGLPTEWSRFSRSSNWDDIKQGVKGFLHKFAISCLDHAFTATIKIQKGKKKPKIESKKIHFFAFSVQKGLRPKYRMLDEDNKVWTEISTKESIYDKDIKNIFETLFKSSPSSSDIKKFNSFVGIIDLISKYFNKKQQKDWADAFVEFIWGKHAQKIYRGDPTQDLKVKSAGIAVIDKKLKTNLMEKYKTMINDYYNNY